MVSSVNGSLSLNNPLLGIRLDPGEPGLLKPVHASEATLRVTAQETRNLGRLTRDAIREGRVVVYSGISFQRGQEGSFLITRAGRTTVKSVEDRRPPFRPAEEVLQNLPDAVPEVSKPPERAAPPEVHLAEVIPEEPQGDMAAPPPANDDLARAEFQLLAARRELDRQRLQVQQQPEAEAPALAAPDSSASLEREAQELDRALRRLRFERFVLEQPQADSNRRPLHAPEPGVAALAGRALVPTPQRINLLA